MISIENVHTYSLFMTLLFFLQPALDDIRAFLNPSQPRPAPLKTDVCKSNTGGQNYCEKQGFSGVVAGGNLNIIQ